MKKLSLILIIIIGITLMISITSCSKQSQCKNLCAALADKCTKNKNFYDGCYSECLDNFADQFENNQIPMNDVAEAVKLQDVAECTPVLNKLIEIINSEDNELLNEILEQ